MRLFLNTLVQAYRSGDLVSSWYLVIDTAIITRTTSEQTVPSNITPMYIHEGGVRTTIGHLLM